MIKIIQGTVGMTINGKRTVKTSADGAFSLPKEEEARLVKIGVAEYFQSGAHGPESKPAAPVPEPAPAPPVKEPEENEAPATDTDDESDLDSMTYSEVQDLARSMGISASGKKSEIIMRIEKASGVSMSAETAR